MTSSTPRSPTGRGAGVKPRSAAGSNPAEGTHTRDDDRRLDRIVEDVLPAARALVDAVHYGTRHDVAQVLNWLRLRDQRVALTVVLAAMVDPAAAPEQTLAWLHQRRAGAPVGWINRARLDDALARRATYTGTAAQRRARYAQLRAAGRTPALAAAELGISDRTGRRYEADFRQSTADTTADTPAAKRGAA